MAELYNECVKEEGSGLTLTKTCFFEGTSHAFFNQLALHAYLLMPSRGMGEWIPTGGPVYPHQN